jgi:hypothetical protein
MGFLSNFIARERHARIADYIRGDVVELGCGNAQILKKFGSRLNSYCGIERCAKLGS